VTRRRKTPRASGAARREPRGRLQAAEETLRAIRAERFAATVRKMQQHAANRGLDKMTRKEIDAEIALARKERKAAGAGGR